jgi:acyl-coenzyme A synthetase/AMP-(fatty) acid ligase/acyl carrier protein
MLPSPPASQRDAVPFAARLGDFGDAVAIITGERRVTYAALEDRVAERAAWLGRTRRLVLLTGANDLDAVVCYLAALSGGHPVLLVPGDNPRHVAAMVDAYDPDVVVAGAAGERRFDVRREGTAHDLHPDLALVMSTSGSTGSPKAVRLSADNLQSNAEAIATYLAIRPIDRAITSLPMHYCYGLSVLNSHLSAGAGLVLTDLSVVDACFWDLIRTHQVASLAGVPYTFELLERVGFAGMQLPQLRYLTQAGGRMPTERVRRFAELGQGAGWDLFVMYGQTEATARIAYLPPDLAHTRPEAIGRPIPGGALRIEPFDDRQDVGELVYTGRNVMMGYAETAQDLARGPELAELLTGDVARLADDGLFEVIGRRSRFVKILGLRVDLDQVERLLVDEGVTAACTGLDERLVVAIEASRDGGVDAAEAALRKATGLPVWAVEVHRVETLPRTATGKPDYRAVAAVAAPAGDAESGEAAADVRRQRADPARLRALYAELLGRSDVTDQSSFVSLEGDSLSYVEVSIRLEDELGRLPAQWHTRTIADLAAQHDVDTASRRSIGRQVETNVVLRALAILMIVASHANLFALVGGAHVLLGVAGFNMGRFHLAASSRVERLSHLGTSVLRVVVPSVLWIGSLALLTGAYPWETTLLLNGLLGPNQWSEPEWYFWFIEAVVWSIVLLAAVLAIPVVDRLERRFPFGLAAACAALALLPRFEVLGLGGEGDRIHATLAVFWLFALGWAAAQASRVWQRVLVSAMLVAAVPGFFEDGQREMVVAVGMLLLVWVPHLRVPRMLVPALGVLAATSLYIYLTHWQVYPHLEDDYPLLALLASLLVGILFARCAMRLMAGLERLIRAAWRHRRLRAHDIDSGGGRRPLRGRRADRHRDPVPTGAP